MTLWFVFALMTAVAIFAVLWPLGQSAGVRNDASEATVYKDQLSEIDRDVAAGLIASPEADAARVEISRRLLSAADHQRAPPTASSIRTRRIAATVALVGLPVLSMALYLPLGSPRLGDFPLADRTGTPAASEPLDNLVAQVEAHLEKNPTDGRGWNVLAPVLARLGRYEEAVRAYRNSITYNGDGSERRADLGEALVAAAGGVVTSEAKTEFERAVALNADEVKASYFLGLAAEQDGRGSDADDAISAAKDMNEADRGAMIRGMVERLATRLKQNGDDVEGWLRLVRAYMVMGDRDKARGALADARQAVANDAERLRQLNEGLKNLGLDG
jgi:cytochrome c-type biogenesis protein CcmH